MFANSSLDLRLAFFAVLVFCQSRRLVSAAQLADMLGVSGLASQLIRNKIWDRLAVIAPGGQIGGPGLTVEIDELLVSKYIRRRRSETKYNVLGITDRSICRVFLLPDRKKSTLIPIIREHVAPGSIVNTDGWVSYRGLKAEGYEHLWCNHSKGFFKGLDGATTTFIDGYWSELKLSLAITHNGVSEARASVFFAAHACRFSYRDNPTDLFWSLVGCRPGDLREIVARKIAPESVANYGISHAGRNSFGRHLDILSSEQAATKRLSEMCRRRLGACPKCFGTKWSKGMSDLRIRCLGCGAATSIRSGSTFENSKVPIHIWFALIWLTAACRDGVSIHFASKFLGVSRQAGIAMQRAIRRGIEIRQSTHRIGGSDQDVHVRLFRLRVKAPPGRPRLNHRTVIVGVDRTDLVVDVLPQRSCQYVALWSKKRIRPASRVHHPDTTAFRMMSSLDFDCVPQIPSAVRRSRCAAAITLIKKYLRRFHKIVPYGCTQSYLKAFEAKRSRDETDLIDLLEQLSFPDQVAS